MRKVSKENAKPQIRFKGFSEDWERRKLLYYADFYTGNGLSWNDISKDGKQECILYGNLYTDYKMIADKVIYHTNSKIKNPVYSEFGDVLIPASDTTPTGLARATSLEKSGVLLGGDINIIRPKDEINGSCLSLAINTNKDELIKLIKGTTVRHIHNVEIKNVEIALPLDLTEQLKLASYFKSIDYLITFHQRKYEKLHNIKKSMLEKMFPQNGSNIPEIRFKGFTEVWEQRKLGELYTTIGNAFVGTATPYYVEHGHFYLESNNVKDGQINHNSEIFINDEFYEKQKDKWLHTGDMVMVQSGHVGHAAVIPEELDNTAAHALIMFRDPKTNIEPYFLNYQYQTDKSKKKIENITTGNTIKHILASDMQNFVVDVPKYEEQKAIGDYFRHLDHLLTLHQRKLEKLKNIKQSMLEKMFV